MREAIRNWGDRTGWRAYLSDSMSPLHSLLLVLPCLAAYELATRYGEHVVRNGADVWLDHLLRDAGTSPGRWLPLATVAGLLAWHYLSGRPWRVRGRVVAGMAMESSLYAFCLFFIAGLVWSEWPSAETATNGAPTVEMRPMGGSTPAPLVPSWLMYCGAGVYEELLFRAILLPLVLLALLRMAAPRTALGLAIVLTSLLFALVHYDVVNPYGDLFSWKSFWFRTAAGIAFSLLFLARGLGIAALAHVGYDILATAG